jgi:hypothetical protein
MRYDDDLPDLEDMVVCEGDSTQWSVGITRESIEIILKSETIAPVADMLALWMFYAYTARWQKTNRPKATVAYVMSGLGWGRDKVRKARHGLSHLRLIQDIQELKEENGKWGAAYVQVNHLCRGVRYDAPLKTRRASKPSTPP